MMDERASGKIYAIIPTLQTVSEKNIQFGLNNYKTSKNCMPTGIETV